MVVSGPLLRDERECLGHPWKFEPDPKRTLIALLDHLIGAGPLLGSKQTRQRATVAA
jgi:hypothetical protein